MLCKYLCTQVGHDPSSAINQSINHTITQEQEQESRARFRFLTRNDQKVLAVNLHPFHISAYSTSLRAYSSITTAQDGSIPPTLRRISSLQLLRFFLSGDFQDSIHRTVRWLLFCSILIFVVPFARFDDALKQTSWDLSSELQMKRKTRDRDRERKRFAGVVRELAEFQTLTSECHILRKCRQHAPRSSSSSSTTGIGYLRSQLKLLDDSKQRRSTHQACFDSKIESSWNESFKIPAAFVPSLSVSSSPSSPSSSQAWTNFHTGLHGETSVPHESPDLGLQVFGHF